MRTHARLARICVIAALLASPVLLGRCDQRPVITVQIEGLEDSPDIKSLALVADLAGHRLSVMLPVQREARVALLPDAVGRLTLDVAGVRSNRCSVARGQTQAEVTSGSGQTVRLRLVRQICNEACFCWENPLPMGNSLKSVWGSSASDVWAVGDAGTIRHFNGRIWEPPTPPVTPEHLAAVWGTGPGSVWAIGAKGVILRYNGFAWQVQPSPATTNDYLRWIWGSGPSDIWVLTHAGAALHWNGTEWSWFESRPPSPPDLSPDTKREMFSAVAGIGPTDVWFAGDYISTSGQNICTLSHFDGTGWRREPSLPRPAGAIRCRIGDLWVGRDEDVWVVSGHQYPLPGDKYRYSMDVHRLSSRRGVWSVLPTPKDTGIRRIRGGTDGHPWIVGTDREDPTPFFDLALGNGIVWRWEENAWRQIYVVKDGGDRTLNDLWLSPQNNLFAVGNNATVLTGQAGQWTEGPEGSTSNLKALWASQPDEIWAVGESGTILRWDGIAWRQVASPAKNDSTRLQDIFGLASNDLWAVGYEFDAKRGVVLRYDGVAWRWDPAAANAAPLANVVLNSVWGRSSADLWVAGQLQDPASSARGVILRRVQESWSLDPRTNSLDLAQVDMRGVWGLDDQQVAIGNRWTSSEVQSEVYERTFPGTWQLVKKLPGAELLRLRGGVNQELWAMGRIPRKAATLLRRAGTGVHPRTWEDLSSKIEQHKDLVLTDVHAAGADEEWFSGYLLDDPGSGCAKSFRGAVLHGVAGKWEVMPSGAATDLRSIVSTQSGDIWVAGGGGTILRRRIVSPDAKDAAAPQTRGAQTRK